MNRHDWKNRLLSALLCMVMVLSLLGTALAAGENVYYGRLNADKVRFRKTASSSSGWWCYLDTGWVVEISEEKGDYYKVRCNIPNNLDRNYIGYLMKDFVDPMTANEQILFLSDPKQPTGDAAYVTQGANVIAPPAGSGDSQPTNQPEQATEKPTEKPADDESTGIYGYVTEDDVFFRQAPGSDIYWGKLPYGWMLEVLSKKEPDKNGVTWYEVRGGIPENVDGTYKGYIHGDYFKLLADGEEIENPTQKPEEQATEKPTQKPTNAPVVSDKTVGVINTDKVFFRSKANTSSMYWCFLHTGWELEVTGQVTNSKGQVEWYKVKGGIPADPNHVYHGYIMADYLDLKGASATEKPTQKPSGDENMSHYGLIQISGTNVREKADADSKALTALSTGTLVEWLGELNGFVEIRLSSGLTGYVKENAVRRLTQDEYETLTGATDKPTQQPTQKPTEQPNGELGYIKLIKGGVNVRKTPNGSTLTPTSDLWLPKGTVLAYYAQPVRANGYDWIKVAYQNGFGYIRSDCYEIMSVAEQPETTPDIDANATGYIRLTKGGVNLRSDASMSQDGVRIYGREDKDTVLPFFGKKADKSGTTWYYVYSEKHERYGYLSGDFAVLCNADGSDITHENVGGTVTGYAVTTAGKVYIRQNTSTSSKHLAQVPKSGTVLEMWNDVVTVSGVKWIPVNYEGVSGYIHGNYAYQLGQWQLDEYNQSGVVPTPTASPTPVPTGDSEYIIITDNNVYVRSGPGTGYAPIGQNNKTQVDQGEVFKFTRKQVEGNVTWYRIVYNSSTIGYIHGSFARVMTKLEYLEWAENNTPSAGATATPDIEINPPSQFVVLRLGSTGNDVLELQKALHKLGYLAKSDITGDYLKSTEDAVKAFQKAIKVTVDGIAGKTTQSEVYRLAGANNNGNGSTQYNGVTLYPVEMVDWNTGDIQKVWAKGETAQVTDVYTGISFIARRWSGYLHADVEPLTAKDTAAMCRIYKVNNAQEIEDRTNELQTWRRRPLWITVDGRTFAASMYGVPHNYPAGDTIADNEYSGQFCIHFVNSKVHKSEKVDVDSAANGYFGHQSAIKYAYDKSVSGTK